MFCITLGLLSAGVYASGTWTLRTTAGEPGKPETTHFPESIHNMDDLQSLKEFEDRIIAARYEVDHYSEKQGIPSCHEPAFTTLSVKCIHEDCVTAERRSSLYHFYVGVSGPVAHPKFDWPADTAGKKTYLKNVYARMANHYFNDHIQKDLGAMDPNVWNWALEQKMWDYSKWLKQEVARACAKTSQSSVDTTVAWQNKILLAKGRQQIVTAKQSRLLRLKAYQRSLRANIESMRELSEHIFTDFANDEFVHNKMANCALWLLDGVDRLTLISLAPTIEDFPFRRAAMSSLDEKMVKYEEWIYGEQQKNSKDEGLRRRVRQLQPMRRALRRMRAAKLRPRLSAGPDSSPHEADAPPRHSGGDGASALAENF